MIPYVVFDLDGTLLNTLDDLADAGNFVCAAHGWPQHPVQAYRRFVGNGIPKLVERFSPPEARDPATLRQTLEEYTARYNDHKQDKTRPYDGIGEMLQALSDAGVAFACVTNKDDALARQLLPCYFAPRFAAVQGRAEGVPPKPDPAGTRRVLAAMGADEADAAQALFVGDSDVDIATGRAAGLRTCGVLWGFRDRAELQAAGADFFAETPAALAQLILQGPPGRG